MLHKKTHPHAKFSIVPEEGWFGQPKYSTRSKKTFYVVSVSAFIFFILFVKPIRSLLIQRIRAGSSFRLLAFKTFYSSLAGVTYLRYTVLTSPNKGETAVHCCDPPLSVLVMLVSRNVFSRSINLAVYCHL